MLPHPSSIAARTRLIALFCAGLVVGVLSSQALSDASSPTVLSDTPAPFVKATSPRPVSGNTLGTSGTVRARTEAPLAFQVGGRIAQRSVDAGQPVAKGDTLMKLDPRDLHSAVEAAEAEHAAANAATATAEADFARNRKLGSQDFISPQAVERAELVLRESQARRNAAAARLNQARNTLGYAVLQAPTDGVMMDVTGEPGQVVAPGQPVAVLAHGPREVEVFFPEHVSPPPSGVALVTSTQTLPLILRETAGSVDPIGRTLRARYAFTEEGDGLVLGSVLRTRFELIDTTQTSGEGVFELPISAIDERGGGARVWIIRDGKLEATAIRVLALDDAGARVAGPLTPTDRIIALGVHLMQDGMAVRERGE